MWPRLPRARASAEADAPAWAAGGWERRFLRVLWVGSSLFILLLIISITFTRSAAGLYNAQRDASVLLGPVVLLALYRIRLLFNFRNAAGKWPRILLLGVVGVWLGYAAGRSISNAAALRKLPVMEWHQPQRPGSSPL